MSNYSQECNDVFKDFPVTVEFDGQVLTIKVPPIHGLKDPTGEYESADLRLAAYVEAAIDKWKLDHPEIDLSLHGPFDDFSKHLLVITRRARDCSEKICRNDTFRCPSVLSVICSALNIPDEQKYLTLVNRFELENDSEDACTEFQIGKAEILFLKLAHETYYTVRDESMFGAPEKMWSWDY